MKANVFTKKLKGAVELISGRKSLTVHKTFGGDEDYIWSPTVKKFLR
jgi:hypothetical protein